MKQLWITYSKTVLYWICVMVFSAPFVMLGVVSIGFVATHYTWLVGVCILWILAGIGVAELKLNRKKESIK